MADKNPFFKQEDLESVEFRLEGMNVTSGTKVPTDTIRLIQILDGGIWVEVPLRSCTSGHTLSFDITARKCTGVVKRETAEGKSVEEKTYTENKNHVSGTVEEIDTDSKTFLHVKLMFRQYSLEQWNNLLGHFSAKQGSINGLLKSTRK